MAVAVIADCHLGGPGGEPAPLLAQLDALDPERCERLVLLGDVFQVWVAAPRFETADVRAVVAALARLAERGVPVDYVEGNRDFFVRGGAYERYFDRVADEIDFTAGGRRYLVVHGDGLDPSDRKYRFWRWLSKNRVSRAIALALPAGWTRRAVHGTERGLAGTNFKHKVAVPEGVIRAYAERRLAEGHDQLLLGHYHEERRWRVAGGEVLLLEAWFHGHRVYWFD